MKRQRTSKFSSAFPTNNPRETTPSPLPIEAISLFLPKLKMLVFPYLGDHTCRREPAMPLLPLTSCLLNHITKLGTSFMNTFKGIFENVFEIFYLQNLIVELNCELLCDLSIQELSC